MITKKVKCMYCDDYIKKTELSQHINKNHNIIYVALEEKDLNRLVQFIFLKDDRLLTNSLVKTLQSYNRRSAKKQMMED